MSKVSFLCELPPPFGGVTVKDQLLLDTVFAGVNNIDFCTIKNKPFNVIPVFFRMITAFIRGDTIIYGFGSKNRLKIALTLQRIFAGKKSLKKCINIVMGGTIGQDIEEDLRYRQLLREIRVNFVETTGMQRSLLSYGYENVDIFPNAKSKKGSKEPVDNQGPIKCVFFSKICKEKGVDYIISEFENISEDENIYLYFYGHIDDEIKERFKTFVERHDKVQYCGVFDSTKDDVYDELNKYDVLLFPTTWVGEGIPGILVEAKMAGVVPIVSNWRFNSEIVIDGEEGIVLGDLKKGSLIKELKCLNDNRQRLNCLKNGSYISRERYSIESYISILKSYLAN